MESIRASIKDLPWIILLLLVIFFDGLVGGLYRLGGKTTGARVIGGIMLASFILSIVSFFSLPEFLGYIVNLITLVFWIIDLVTVITKKAITVLAD